MFVWMLISGIYYFFFAYPVLRFTDEDFRSLFKRKRIFLAGLALFVFTGEVIYYLISHEHFVYYWDYGGYYKMALDLRELYAGYHLGVIKKVFESSLHSDYGQFIPAIIAYPLLFTQGRYVDYIALCYVMFGIPFSLSFSALVYKLTDAKKAIYFFIYLAASLFMPGTFFAMLQGYPGIAAFVPLVCAMWLLLVTGMKKMSLLDAAVLSCSLIFSFVLRRYFSFSVLAFVAASICGSLYRLLYEERPASWKNFACYFRTFLTVGGISVVILLTVLNGLVKRIFFTDYAKMYVAYNMGSFGEKYVNLFFRFGPAVCFLFLASCVVVVVKRRRYIPCMIFAIAYESVATLSFFKVQSPSPQHYWVFWIPVLLMVSLLSAPSYKRKRSVQRLAMVPYFLCFALTVANTLYVFSGSFLPGWKCNLFQRERYYVRNRNDLPQLRELCSYIEGIAAGSQCYVAASDWILNSDIIQKLFLPGHPPFAMAWTADVDQRDGFSADFFNAGIVIATDRDALHLGAEDQSCVTVLNREVKKPASPVGRNFEKKRSFLLDEGLLATVYVRISPVTLEEVDYLEKIYDGLHPELPKLFHERFEEYKKNNFQ